MYVNDSFPAPELDEATSKLVEKPLLLVIAWLLHASDKFLSREPEASLSACGKPEFLSASLYPGGFCNENRNSEVVRA